MTRVFTESLLKTNYPLVIDFQCLSQLTSLTYKVGFSSCLNISLPMPKSRISLIISNIPYVMKKTITNTHATVATNWSKLKTA